MEKYIYLPIHKKSRDADIDQLILSMALIGNSSIAEDWAETDAANMLRRIVNVKSFPQSFTVFVERGYVDRVYRDIYYHHYASRHFEQPRNCLRMFFFEQVRDEIDELLADAERYFIGVCVIQPNGIIGRSYWHPRVFLEKGNYVRTVNFQVSFLGQWLTIPAFPYTMQDREAITCAEVTVLNLSEYYSLSYPEYKTVLLSDIEKVEAQRSAERIFPSQGMSYADVARSLAQTGLSARIYASHAPQITQEAMRRYLYYYAESGIPFGIAVESPERGILHSMVCIGHGKQDVHWPQGHTVNHLNLEISEEKLEFHSCWIANSADAYQTFVVMDDNDTPYKTVRLESARLEWTVPQQLEDGMYQLSVEQLCVPLYKRVFLEVDGAAELLDSFLTSRMGYRAVMERLGQTNWSAVGGTQDNPLIVRLFLASSRTFLSMRIRMLDGMTADEMDEDCIAIYQNLCCPRFVWVCELYDQASFQGADPHPIGEIVVDATARRTGTMSGMNSIVLIHYPHFITCRDPDSGWPDLESNAKKLTVWSPFTQFHGNLWDFKDVTPCTFS